jgi:hypothetical protein
VSLAWLDARHGLQCTAIKLSGIRCSATASWVRDGHPCCGVHAQVEVPRFASWRRGGGLSGTPNRWEVREQL